MIEKLKYTGKVKLVGKVLMVNIQQYCIPLSSVFKNWLVPGMPFKAGASLAVQLSKNMTKCLKYNKTKVYAKCTVLSVNMALQIISQNKGSNTKIKLQKPSANEIRLKQREVHLAVTWSMKV